MLRYFLAGLVLATPAFYWIPKAHLPLAPTFRYVYDYEIESRKATPAPKWLSGKAEPFSGVIHKAEAGALLIGPAFAEPRLIPSSEKWRVHLPFLGNGYFLYKKIGKEISFLTPEHELLWKKEYFSYPDSNVFGDFVVLLTGDNNRVDLVSEDGEPLPQKSVSGNFLSDYRFSVANNRLLLLFSDGHLVLLEKGQKIASYQIKKPKQDTQSAYPAFFAKSAAISYKGDLLAIHYLLGNKDFIEIFSVSSGESDDNTNPSRASSILSAEIESEEKFTLPKAYPHLVHMALNEGQLFVALPDANLHYDLDEEELLSLPKESTPSLYRPVYAAPDFLAYGDGQKLFLCDTKGRKILERFLDTQNRPWRILPARVPQAFAVETASRVEFFSFARPKG